MIGAAIKKDLLLVLSDRGGLLALFLMPVLFMAVFGSVFGSPDSPQAMRLPVYAAAGSEPIDNIVAEVSASPLFEVELVGSADAVREMVARRDAPAGLILPQGFNPLAGEPAELSIDRASAAQVRGMIAGELQARLARASFGVEPSAILEARTPPGLAPPAAEAGGFELSVPGNAVLFGFFLALTIAIAFLEERGGTFRRLCAAPVPRYKLLLAKLAPYFLVGLVQMAFLFGFGRLVLGMEIGGSYLALILLTCAVVLCATCLGLLIASFSGTQKQVGGIGSIALLIFGLLGGAMVPRITMPELMQTIGLATPHAWALDGYYDVILRQGSTVADILPETAALLGFAAVFAAIGAARFRFES
ncbi:MAG: ABC transporter permease [Deltaproteobacteria bacterium]|jgi:ABC-type multidrug transport system permease subunit|nr:ABC transporter permease [Deltaproteobacteria bacterium]